MIIILRLYSMKLTIYRGTKEIGGTLIEVKTQNTKILIDAGYPLFLNNSPIDDNIAKLPYKKLLELGVLPAIEGLYAWDSNADFDAVIISHAHLDHCGLLKYVHPEIPIYISAGTGKLIEVTKLSVSFDSYDLKAKDFKMYEPFQIGDIKIKPYLMDHSAFDAAAFEIMAENKIITYTGDFRGHGRKAVCLDRFIANATKQADVLLTEGTMLGRPGEKVLTESELEELIIAKIKDNNMPVLFQSSSQNIDRIVSFYRAALKLKKNFVIDIYTANVLYELRQLGNNLPYPSKEYSNIKVFYPYRLTQKIFNDIGEKYAKRFSSFHIPKEKLKSEQNNIIMMVRPSMLRDIEKCNLNKGLFIYSLWEGYRDSDYQKKFEEHLKNRSFSSISIHTSGHASLLDIKRVIEGLNPKIIVPIHTMMPEAFKGISSKIKLLVDGAEYEV